MAPPLLSRTAALLRSIVRIRDGWMPALSPRRTILNSARTSAAWYWPVQCSLRSGWSMVVPSLSTRSLVIGAPAKSRPTLGAGSSAAVSRKASNQAVPTVVRASRTVVPPCSVNVPMIVSVPQVSRVASLRRRTWPPPSSCTACVALTLAHSAGSTARPRRESDWKLLYVPSSKWTRAVIVSHDGKLPVTSFAAARSLAGAR